MNSEMAYCLKCPGKCKDHFSLSFIANLSLIIYFSRKKTSIACFFRSTDGQRLSCIKPFKPGPNKQGLCNIY